MNYFKRHASTLGEPDGNFHELTKEIVLLLWGSLYAHNFEAIEQINYKSLPILRYHNSVISLLLQIDASLKGLGTVLPQ